MINNSADVIIVGAGPAGIACAIQLKRYNIDHIIFEKDEVGGLLKNANLIENYPGFPNGISGIKLVQLFNKQSQTAKINIKYETVESVEFLKNAFSVKTNKVIYHSRYLVIASGTKPIVPKIPIIHEDNSNRLFFNIYKLKHIENKNIVIIGAGDCALDYALNLCNENKVIILNRSDKIRALPILQERVLNTENIKYFENISVKYIENKDQRLILTCNPNDETIDADYLLFAIGRKPTLDFININLLKNPCLFQIGDVKNGQFRQTSIAVGDGTFTAMKINKILNQEN